MTEIEEAYARGYNDGFKAGVEESLRLDRVFIPYINTTPGVTPLPNVITCSDSCYYEKEEKWDKIIGFLHNEGNISRKI